MLADMTKKMDEEKKSKVHKIVGAGVGWVIAGPVGAALGLLVGHTVEKNPGLFGKVLEDKALCKHFDVLGVPYDADGDKVRAAYKRLAQKYHPDRFAENTDPVLEELAREKMCKINDAYATIMGSLKKD
jgi:DnaJ-domain-containing protein 1